MGHSADHCWYRYHTVGSSSTHKAAYISDSQDHPHASTKAGYSSPAPVDSYLDYGASTHLTNQFNNLHLLTPYHGQDSITIGDRTQLPITHSGQHTINTPNSKFHLNDLLYVPTLKHKLLSVYHLTSTNNCTITFDDGFMIQDKKTHRILHQGRIYNGLYPLAPNFSAYSATTTMANT